MKWLALAAISINRPNGVASGGGGGLTCRHNSRASSSASTPCPKRHMHEQAEFARGALRQYVAELTEQEAANHEERGEPVQSLWNRAVARL